MNTGLHVPAAIRHMPIHLRAIPVSAIVDPHGYDGLCVWSLPGLLADGARRHFVRAIRLDMGAGPAHEPGSLMTTDRMSAAGAGVLRLKEARHGRSTVCQDNAARATVIGTEIIRLR